MKEFSLAFRRLLLRLSTSTMICLLLGCASSKPTTSTSSMTTETVSTAIVSQPLAEPEPRPDETTSRSNDAVIRGSGAFVRVPRFSAAASTTKSDDELSLNFVNADVSEVAKAVLGDYLKLNYVIDASVQGAVTIQASQPLPRTAVLPALEASFRLSGLALLRDGEFYRIVPIAGAARDQQTIRLLKSAQEPGFGVEIVPLHYISATEIQRLLEPIAPSGSILRADSARNLLMIAGTSQERAALIDNIATFDVNWMLGMSFAIFQLKSADAKVVATELGDVLGGKDSPLSGLVRVSPIERMNALLIISSQPQYIDQMKSWIERLDQAQESVDRHLYVYYVQNGRAADLANVLNKVWGKGGSSASPQTKSQSSTSSDSIGSSSFSSSGTTTSTNGAQQTQQGNSSSGEETDDQPAQPAQAASGSGLRITSDERNNALLILATPKEYEPLESAVKRLDVAPLQVMLEAAIAEVTLTDNLQFGIQYSFKSGTSHQITYSNGSTSALTTSFPGFAYVFSSGSDIQAVLTALQGITHVEVVSAPRVLVLNNQTAELKVGDDVPIASQSQQSTLTSTASIINTIEYRETGVILKVTPRVNESGLVQMDIAQEVSDVAQTTTSTLDSPTIEQRKLTSTIAVQDGETVALGGLIKDSRTKGKTGLPFLQQIPILGTLFGQTTDSGGRTELLVMITPHVIQGIGKLRDITNELRLKMGATEPLLRPCQIK